MMELIIMGRRLDFNKASRNEQARYGLNVKDEAEWMENDAAAQWLQRNGNHALRQGDRLSDQQANPSGTKSSRRKSLKLRYNTFDELLPPEPPGWSSCGGDSRTVKQKRFVKALNRARGFLGSQGCQTSRIPGVRQLNYLLSICFGVSIDRSAKPKTELIRVIRIIADMGRKARKRKVRAAQKSGHPAMKAVWNPDRLAKS
jgi:hypothetical protein